MTAYSSSLPRVASVVAVALVPLVGAAPARVTADLETHVDRAAIGEGDLAVANLASDGAPNLFANAGTGDEHSPEFSPNGRWLAYQTDDTGVNEVFVIDFPDGDRQQVSADGGHSPLWSPSGDELFYVDAADQLWSIEVSSDSLFRALSRTQLFSVARYSDGGSLMWRFRTTYTVEPDAEGLLFADPFRPTAGTMFVKLNIFEWLRERMGN